MNKDDGDKVKLITIADLYPALDGAKRQEVEDVHHRCAAPDPTSFERIKAAPQDLKARMLTNSCPEVRSEASKGRTPPIPKESTAFQWLTEDDLREFHQIWKREFNEVLTLGQARHHASQLMELYALLARPVPYEQGSLPPYRHDLP